MSDGAGLVFVMVVAAAVALVAFAMALPALLVLGYQLVAL